MLQCSGLRDLRLPVLSWALIFCCMNFTVFVQQNLVSQLALVAYPCMGECMNARAPHLAWFWTWLLPAPPVPTSLQHSSVFCLVHMLLLTTPLSTACTHPISTMGDVCVMYKQCGRLHPVLEMSPTLLNHVHTAAAPSNCQRSQITSPPRLRQRRSSSPLSHIYLQALPLPPPPYQCQIVRPTQDTTPTMKRMRHSCTRHYTT